MKVKPGEPMLTLDVATRKELNKLLTQTNKAYELNAGLIRLFTRSHFDSQKGEWEFKELTEATIPLQAMRDNLVDIHHALDKADQLVMGLIVDLDEAKDEAKKGAKR